MSDSFLVSQWPQDVDMMKASYIAVSYSLCHPNAHLCHYQNKENCFLWEIAANAPGDDQQFFPQKCRQHCDKEMSPFILEENVLYKLPPTIFSLRQQSLRTSLRIHVKAEPQPHCTMKPGQLAKSMASEVCVPGFMSYLYNLLTLQPWASYLASLGVTYLCPKMEMLIALNS